MLILGVNLFIKSVFFGKSEGENKHNATKECRRAGGEINSTQQVYKVHFFLTT